MPICSSVHIWWSISYTCQRFVCVFKNDAVNCRMEEWKQVAGRVQHMKICSIKAFRRTKKKEKKKRRNIFHCRVS